MGFLGLMREGQMVGMKDKVGFLMSKSPNFSAAENEYILEEV